MTFVFSQLASTYKLQLIRTRWPPRKHLSNSTDEEREQNRTLIIKKPNRTRTQNFGFFPISSLHKTFYQSIRQSAIQSYHSKHMFSASNVTKTIVISISMQTGSSAYSDKPARRV